MLGVCVGERFMTDVIDVKNPIEWARLDDDTWRIISSFLGLDALSLRRTCSAFQRRVLALKELPVATQLARRVLQFLEGMDPACPRLEFCSLRTASIEREVSALLHDLRHASFHDLFAVIDAFNNRVQLVLSLRPCSMLIHQLTKVCVLKRSFEQRVKKIRSCNGEGLSEDELVSVMRRFYHLNLLAPTTFIYYNLRTDPHSFTTTWHIAAAQGKLKVLKFLYYETMQTLHVGTPGGNNALAHARAALEDELSTCASESKQAKEAEARYAPTIAFLTRCGLAEYPWRREGGEDDELSGSDASYYSNGVWGYESEASDSEPAQDDPHADYDDTSTHW
jgi:hypothetical protein